jgi:integrase
MASAEGPTPAHTDPAAAAARAIRVYSPGSVSARAAEFARAAVSGARPQRAERAKALLWAACRLAAFAEGLGLDPSPEALLRAATIERFVEVGCPELSPASRRTLRTNLRALARATEAHPQPPSPPLPRERAKPTYSEAEIAGYLALAEAQPTRARRMHASALVCLGAGAGLIGSELRHLRGRDVHRRSGGLVVAVGGRRARAVPVLARFHENLGTAAAFAGRGYLVGGRDPDRKNLTDTLTAALCSDAGLPRLEAGRLRATWLARCAELIGLSAFMRAAGIRCSQRLGDLVADLPEVEEADAVALLGGGDEGKGSPFPP